jgi:hypothetical protein
LRRAPEGWSCRWVPGTVDRVRLNSCSLQEREIGVREVARLAGPSALHALYLRGHYRGDCQDSPCLTLGCEAQATTAQKASLLAGSLK